MIIIEIIMFIWRIPMIWENTSQNAHHFGLQPVKNHGCHKIRSQETCATVGDGLGEAEMLATFGAFEHWMKTYGYGSIAINGG